MFSITRRSALVAFLMLAGLAGGQLPAHRAAAQDREETAVRVAVVDFTTNAVKVLDGTSSEPLAVFGMPGPGSVYGSSTGRWFYVIHTAQNRVSIIDSGLRATDHGDHVDLQEGPPYVRGTTAVGRRPIDTWVENGLLTVHSDDDGTLAVFDDKRLEIALDYTEIRGAGAGHNNAVVLGDTVLLSLAAAGRVTAYRLDGSSITSWEGCPGTHGWAVAGTTAAAGCEDGVMLFTLGEGQIRMTKLNNPSGTPMGTRVSTIRANPKSPVMIGNWGSGLAIIRSSTAELQPVSLPAAPLAFSFTADGSHLIVLTPDGRVHALDPQTGRVLGTVAAVAPYAAPMMGQPSIARPGMTVGNGVAYLTDPTMGQIVEINANTMTVIRRIDVGGTPSSIGMVAVTGVTHD